MRAKKQYLSEKNSPFSRAFIKRSNGLCRTDVHKGFVLNSDIKLESSSPLQAFQQCIATRFLTHYSKFERNSILNFLLCLLPVIKLSLILTLDFQATSRSQCFKYHVHIILTGQKYLGSQACERYVRNVKHIFACDLVK